MPPMNRRLFLVSSLVFPIGCTLNRGERPNTGPVPVVRAPVVGQSWQYAKHDLFTRALVDTEVDLVSAVGKTIDIDARTQGSDKSDAAQGSLWGLGWLHRYFSHAQPSAALPSEVQAPWGMVLVDPHWNQLQVYEAPIPLWPAKLQPGWETRILSKYKTAESNREFRWEQTMKAEAWETVTVAAGQFKTLRYVNSIRFGDIDPARTDSVRHETLWIAPEVGRWVARESKGTYYLDDSVDDQPHSENSYRWELEQWS